MSPGARWTAVAVIVVGLTGVVLVLFGDRTAPGPELQPSLPPAASAGRPAAAPAAGAGPAKQGERAPVVEPPRLPAPSAAPARRSRAAVHGQVTEAETGEPVGGVTVKLRAGMDVRQTLSGPDGAFAFPGVREGVWKLEALPEAHAPASCSVRVRAGETSEVAVRLVRGVQVQVTVVEAGTGRRLPDVRVRLWHRPTGIGREGSTDERGQLTLVGLPAAPWTDGVLQVTRPGYFALQAPSGHVWERAGKSWLRVRMARAAKLSGRVVKQGEGPAAGVSVGVDLEGTRFVHVVPPLAADELCVETDAGGRFAFAAFPPLDRVIVTVTAAGRMPHTRAVALAPGEERRGWTIRLGGGVDLAGFVYDPDGRPVAGAEVLIGEEQRLPPRGAGQSFATLRATVKTDRRGAFLVAGMKPGRYRLKACQRGWLESRERALRVRRGVPPGEVLLRLQREAAPFEGRVVDSAGRPLAGFEVAAYAYGQFGSFGELVWPRVMTTGKDGRFRLTGLRGDWSYTLEVKGPGLAEPVRQGPFFPGRQDLRFVIQTPGGLIGRLPRELEKVAVVAAIRDDDVRSTCCLLEVTSPFTFTGLQPGRYAVEARDARGTVLAAARDVVVRAGQTTDGVVLVAVHPPGISGLVVDGAGQPLAGVAVSTGFRQRGDEHPGRRETATDGEGRFTLAPLAPGTYDLVAGGTGTGFAVRPGVKTGKDHVRIVLRASATLRISVRAAEDGRALPGAVVLLMTRRRAHVLLTAGREGRLEVRVSPGFAIVAAGLEAYERQIRRVPALPAGRVVLLEFHLRRKRP